MLTATRTGTRAFTDESDISALLLLLNVSLLAVGEFLTSLIVPSRQ